MSRADQPVRVDRAVTAAWAELLLMKLGAGSTSATQVIEHLLAAEDAGHPSHGLRMLISIAAATEQGNLDPSATPVVEMASGSVARIDGRMCLGPPAGLLAMAEAVRLAHSCGTSAVTIRACGSLGRLAPYAESAAASGCAAFICANDGGAGQNVVPPGGTEVRLSTNPIAFGFPRARSPHLVVDMATSAYAHGTLGALGEAGEPYPADALLPGAADRMLPMAGHKGFALAMVVEALAGALTGAGVVRPDPPPESQGALMVAIDVAALGPSTAVSALEAAIAWVRSAPTADGRPIRIPGEHRSEAFGSQVSIAPGLWPQLVELSTQLKVDPPIA